MISRVVIKKQPGRRWLTFVAAVGLLVTSMGIAGSALAVHDLHFQLDGDTTNTAYSPPLGSNPELDWNGIFDVATASGTQTVSVNSSNVGAGKTFDAANFVRDFKSGSSCPGTLNSSSTTTFCTGDDTTYATGSKDTLGIGNGGWQCNHDNNTNSKIDIMNAYVLAYTRADGHKLFYFGLEKNKDNGTNDVGFWFLQSGASCSKPTSGSGLNFTGGHVNGDTLVVSEFSGGGGVSTIKAFAWAAAASGPLSGDGGCIDSHGNPDPSVTLFGEKGCNNKPIATGADCKKTGGGDSLCATTNAKCTDATKACSLPWNDNVTTKWLTSDATLGVGATVVPPDFFEGGIDITQAFQGSGTTAPSCFNTIVPDTRSSASPTATLFDYTLNQIGQCAGSLSTQQNFGSSKEIGADGTISSGTDTAELKITGTANWGGTLKFYLCGPDVTSCDTHGVVVTTLTVANTDGTPDCGADCVYTSGTATLTSAAGTGQYCWHAKFVPDPATALAGVQPQEDNGANECFTVTPKTPTLATAAVAAASGLSPTIYGHLADVNGSGSVTSADDANVFYGDTSIINGGLDCNAWGTLPADVNKGTAGDGVINASDDCTLIGYDGTADGVTIQVVDGQFTTADGNNIANGTPLPTVFNATSPNDPSVVNADFAWSTIFGRVDANGSGTITGDDCSINVVDTYDVLGSVCQGYTIPQGNGLVDLNDDGKITTADACTNGCFLGHNVSVGYVLAGSLTLGSTLYDIASLTGTANNPNNDGAGGDTGLYKSINGTTKPADSNIDWTLYGPAGDGSAQCTTAIAGAPTPSSIPVTGDNQYGPVSYTTNHAGDTAGKYTFAASYGGDGPNTLGATAVGCDDTGANGEQVTVTGSASSSSAQRWLPNDRIVLNTTGGTTLDGTLTATLYKGVFGGTAANCTVGTGVATGVSQTFDTSPLGVPDASGTVYNTTNSTFFVGTNPGGTAGATAGTYFWLIHYDDVHLTDPADRCETSTLSPITDN